MYSSDHQTARAFTVAGLTTATASATPPSPDAKLIGLCDQLVSGETEMALLIEYDAYATDFGPNHARYRQLCNNSTRLEGEIEECAPPTTHPGRASVARAALVWVERDHDGNPTPRDLLETLAIMLAQEAAPDFVWPPRSGSCPMAHWASPPSPKEHEEHAAAVRARLASMRAGHQARISFAREIDEIRRAWEKARVTA